MDTAVILIRQDDIDVTSDMSWMTPEELAEVKDGTLVAYGIGLTNDEGEPDWATTFIWGNWAAPGYDGTYATPDAISNEYLRETAKDVWQTREVD